MTVAEQTNLGTYSVTVCFDRVVEKGSVLVTRVISRDGIAVHALTPVTNAETDAPGCMKFLNATQVDLHAAGELKYRVGLC
jgi:hypothetical protein